MSSTCINTTSSSIAIRNAIALVAASGALLGYIILNLANQEELGLGLAIPAASFSGSLNAIFHGLAILQIPIRGTKSDIPLLAVCATAATLGTGYLYAVTKQASLQVISSNYTLAMSIALFYQLSWVLPISLVLYFISSQLGKLISCNKKVEASVISENDETASLALSINSQELLLAKEEALPQKANKLELVATLVKAIIAITCTAAMITNSGQAAFHVMKDAPEDNVIDSTYKKIYGSSIEGAIAAHLPQAGWAIVSGMNGLTAITNCGINFYQDPSLKKAITAALALCVLGFTCFTTYLVATYGQNSESGLDLSILIFALGAAFLGNFDPGVKYAQGLTGLSEGPKVAVKHITNPDIASTFYQSGDPSEPTKESNGRSSTSTGDSIAGEETTLEV